MKYPLAIDDDQQNIFDKLKSKYSVLNQDKIKDKVYIKVQEWQKEITKKLNLSNPFYNNQEALKLAQNELQNSIFDIVNIENDFQNYQELKKITTINIDTKYWNDEIKKLNSREKKLENKPKSSSTKVVKKTKVNTKESIEEDKKLTRKLLQTKWAESLEKKYLNWEIEEIDKYRKELIKNLEKWLKLIQEIDDLLSQLSLDNGILFDLSKGELSAQDISQLKRWVEYITQNDGVKELCDMLGRLRIADKTSKEEMVKVTSHITQTIPDINSKEEIVGIKIGKDLEHILPQELALLSDDDTSILFDLKYIEGRLMCFDMEGTTQETIQKEEMKNIKVSDEEKLGPIIICVDTSGSMSGAPETIAKAVTLYMASRAISQNRNCYLINFSTDISTLDLSGGLGLKKVIEFLKMSFHGGTDATPALSHAIKMLKDDDYKKADILMISDFVMNTLPNNIIENIQNAKSEKNKFYSLAIGNLFLESRLKDIFDDEWVYDSQNSSIHNISKIVQSIIM